MAGALQRPPASLLGRGDKWRVYQLSDMGARNIHVNAQCTNKQNRYKCYGGLQVGWGRGGARRGAERARALVLQWRRRRQLADQSFTASTKRWYVAAFIT